MLELTFAVRTEAGARASNEDAVQVGRRGATLLHAVLSDGAGGHAGGAEASRQVVAQVDAALAGAASAFAPDALDQALRDAHVGLQRTQRAAAGRERMQATVVALWLDAASARALWTHVGDSRLYRLRWGAVERLTRDDSVVQRLVDGGVLSTEQAADHPMKNQLLAAIGMQDHIEPHTSSRPERLDDGDVFLLCSDGWWDGLADAELAATLFDAESPEAWLAAMRARILALGTAGQDNFSAIAVWAADLAETTRPMEAK